MKKHLAVFMLFFILVVVLTYPFIFKILTYIPGFFSTDEPFGNLWDIWRINYSLSHKLSLIHTNLMCYPYGFDVYASGYISYLWVSLVIFFSLFTPPILIYNFQLLLNLFLSGIFVYLLIFYLTDRNRLAAIFSGIIFAFCPYQFARIWQHIGLTYNQWIPLSLFAAIWLKESYSKKSIFLLLLSLFLLFSFDWSIMYMTIIVLGSLIIYNLFYHWKTKLFKQRNKIILDFQYTKRIIAVLAAIFIILLPQFIPIIKNSLRLSSSTPSSAHNPYHRPFEDLFSQSAKPLSYFLPAIVHPIFGKFTEQFVGSQLYGVSFTEHTLYLGWMPLILAFVAFKKWRKKRKERRLDNLGTVPLGGSVNSSGGDSPYKEDFYIGFFVFLAIVAWLFSQPPWWKFGPIKIYMPSFFMYKILPMFRAYCRFGIVVMLAVAVLAGFGLKFILGKFKTQKAKLAITTLFCSLVLFEFWNWPPYKVIDVSKVPAVYYWLKAQPGDLVIAEYPLDADSANEIYKFYQTKHEKKIINGTIPGTHANKVAQTITRLSDSHTTGVLKWMGVKYVLVHKEDYLKSELVEEIEELNKIPLNPNLKLIKTFPPQECPRKDIMCVQKTGPIDIYEVVAQSPIEPEVKKCSDNK